MDIDDLMNELDQFTTDLGEVTTISLQELAARLPGQIVSGLESAGKDLNRPNSKGLRGSIRATVDNNRLILGMNYYGYYQIFGVKGTGSKTIFGLPASVAGAFAGKREGDIFSFKKIKHSGIAAAPGAANPIINLADLIAETITDQI